MSQEQLIDLEKKQLGLLKKIIKQQIPDKTVWAYGSRVAWKANEISDLDLTVFGCESMEIYALKEALEESNLLISVDVMNWEEIPDNFRTNIKKQYVVLQEKRELEGWREVRLGDVPIKIIDGDRGKNYPHKNDFSSHGHCLFLNTKNVTKTGFSFSELNFISKEKDDTLRKGRLQRGDTILTTRGTVGNVAFYNETVPYNHVRINSGMIIVRPNGIDEIFTYYLFKHLNNNFSNFSSGSAQPQLPIRDLNEIPVPLPPLPEQKAIAEVLSSLDDKIDLLHRQNKTLEDMAQTLFRQWFIEQSDENWEERPLSYFGDIICGKTPSKKVTEYFGGAIPFIKIPDMHGNTFVFDAADTLTEYGKNSQNNKTLPEKSICVSCIATVGLVSMNAFESQTNQQINSIIPKKDEYRYFIYLFVKSSNDLLHAMASGGTATMNLNTGNFAKIMVPMAGEYLVSKFHKIVKPAFDKIFYNQKQIRILENLRDTLLPKLMSGEVRINTGEQSMKTIIKEKMKMVENFMRSVKSLSASQELLSNLVFEPDSSGDLINGCYLDSIFEFDSGNHLRQVTKPA